MYYLKNTNFWMFGLFFFFYFFIMGAYFPFFPIWLHDINHISKSDTGIIFAAISLFSLLFQPLFGLLSDKLGLRKYLLWIITGMLVMFAPFFIFIFGPLLQYNILVGSIVGGIYLGFCFNAGAPAVVADEFQQSLVILFSGRYRVMEPDIKSGTGNLKDPTHCNDRPDFTVIVDKAILQSGSLAKYRAAFFRISRSSSVRLSCAFSLRISVLASSKSCACCPLLSGLTARSHLYRLCADTPSRSDTSAIE